MGTPRDLRIDTLRGLALVGMTIGHMRFPAIKQAFPKFGYIGMAEPFVLLSGLVAGMIYWRLAERRPAFEVWSRGLRRAGFLYLVYVALAFTIIALTLLFRIWSPEFVPYQSRLIVQDPWLAVTLVPVLLFQPGFADVLPMYFVFLAATPFVIGMVRSGHLRACIAGSALLWGLAQLGVGDRFLELVIERVGGSLAYFDILGWQVVFLFGLILGIRRAAGCDPVVPRSRALLVASCALVALFLFTSYGGFGAPTRRGALGWLEDRSAFGPLRVLNLAAAVVVLTRLGELRLPWLEQRWLALLGANSLPVFVYSCLLGYLLTPFAAAPLWGRVAAVGLGVASLTIPALLQQRFREARRPVRAGRAEAGADASLA